MEKNTDYFGDRSDSERMRNVANMVHDIVNPKSKEVEGDEKKPEVQIETAETEEPEVNPVVDLVGKAISSHKPRGSFFMQGVQTDDNPKL